MTQSNAYKWSLFDRICNSGINFVGNIILVRLLNPGDFGLVAMVAIFVAVAYNFSSCGLSDGLIRKTSPTPEDYSTVFVFNGAMGAFFGIMFILLAHPIADFFGYTELVNIMWAIGICFFFQTLSFVQETRMRKELEMKKLAIARLCSTVTALGVGIVLALSGMGYWAIVSTQVFLSFFTFIYMVIMSRWIPKVRFYKQAFTEMFGFGVHLMLAYVLTMIGRNINTFVLGRYSANASGLFSQAQKLEEVPFSTIESAFNSTFFVILSNETSQLERVNIAQAMHRNFVVLYAALGMFMIIISAPVIEFLYGEEWIEAIPIFRILCVYGILYSLRSFYQSVLKAYNMSEAIRNCTAVEVVLQLAFLALFFKQGILMIAWTQVIATAIITLVYLCLYKKCTQIRYGQIIRSLMNNLFPVVLASMLTLIVYSILYGVVSNVVVLGVLFLVFSVFIIVGIKIFIPELYSMLLKYVPSSLKFNKR